MTKFSTEKLIQDLKSPDHSIRDQAALLVDEIQSENDILDKEVIIPVLLDQIFEPKNKDYTGSLVLALRCFDCRKHISKLVEIALTQGFAPADIAIGAIEDYYHNGELNKEHYDMIKSVLSKFNKKTLKDHNKDYFGGFEEMIDIAQKVENN